MATAWAACFSQETVVLEEARYHSSGNSEDGCINRWNVLITPDWYLWKLRFNYILQWQKTRPLLYLRITFYSNLFIMNAISLCEQKLTLVFFFSFTVSFQNKNTFTGKSWNQIISEGKWKKTPKQQNNKAPWIASQSSELISSKRSRKTEMPKAILSISQPSPTIYDEQFIQSF